MHINDTGKFSLAKSFTELAIQNDLIVKFDNAEDTAKEVTTFFNTIIDTISDSDKNE